MDAAFGVVFSKVPNIPAPSWRQYKPSESELGFVASDRLDWSDSSGGVQLVCWHRGAACAERDGAVSFVAGSVRWYGEGWKPQDEWAAQLLAKTRSDSLDKVQQQVRGLFAAGCLDEHGNGWLIADVLGMRLLYWGENDDIVVVATRAALVARALARFERTPERDRTSICWLAYTGYRVGGGTGYSNVRIAPQGAGLRVQQGMPTWEHSNPLVVAPDDELRSRSVTELAEIMYEDIAESLRAALSHPAERHIIRLTGGKDSRLMLGVAVRAELAREFEYETVGPLELDDVRIASELCEHLGLHHDVRYMELVSAEPYADRCAAFIDRTGGLVNAWELATYRDSGELRLSGLCGELLRTYRKIPASRCTNEQISDEYPRSGFGQLGLLRGDLGDQLHRIFLDTLAHAPSPVGDPIDRVHQLSAATRMRFARGGALQELGGTHDVLPLYSPVTSRAAMALSGRDRQSSLLLAEMLRVASPYLLHHRFTDGGWDDHATEYLDRMSGRHPSNVTVSPVPASAPNAAPPTKATSLIEQVQRDAPRQRIEFLADMFATRENAAWELLDRNASLKALDRYADLTARQRHELFGVATAAVWLGN